jgi:hypothetical protein
VQSDDARRGWWSASEGGRPETDPGGDDTRTGPDTYRAAPAPEPIRALDDNAAVLAYEAAMTMPERARLRAFSLAPQ